MGDDNENDEDTPQEPERDEEGLLPHYDVILVGTGLVQSIVASALARAGKSVLQCDGQDSYGELDAVWTLQQLQEQCQTFENDCNTTANRNDKSPLEIPLSSKGGVSSLQFHSYKEVITLGISVGTRVQTPRGEGVVESLPTDTNTVVVQLDRWTLADGKHPRSYIGVDETARQEIDWKNSVEVESYLSEHHGIHAVASLQAREILQPNHSRGHRRRYYTQLALDASPVLVLAVGRAVNGMLASNVADYLEFMSVEGLLWLETKNEKPTLSRVPCNKNDVFSTKLLSPLDKRRLMKFLQLAMDYATQMSIVEEMLQDQTKAADSAHSVATTPQPSETNPLASEEDVQSLNERHLNQGRSLARPQNKAVSTAELQKLQAYMQQDDSPMTFDSYLQQEHKLSANLRSLIRHALALETTRSSTTLSQGMWQLRQHLQALGRYGKTAFLVPMYGSGELSQAFCRSAAVFGATYLLRRAPLGVIMTSGNDDDVADDDAGSKRVHGVCIAGDTEDGSSQKKTIRCDHVILPNNALPNSPSEQRILRRMSLIHGKLTGEGEQRHVLVLPPGSIGDDTTGTNRHVIHGMTLDESVQVAPAGCTLLHLTTTMDEGDSDTLLDQAAEVLLASSSTPLVEMMKVTFSHGTGDSASPNPVSGLHVCKPSGQVLTADVAFGQAEEIFRTICPSAEFLGLSPELTATVQGRSDGKYDDDERLMLESALGMIAREGETRNNEGSVNEESNEPEEMK